MNYLLLVGLGIIWGSSYMFIRIAVAEVPPITLVASRLVLAAFVLVIVLRATGRPIPRSRKLWGAYAVMGFLSGALPYVLIAWGEQYINSSLAALLQATMPIFTIILALFLVDDERMSWTVVLGVVLGFAGVAVLMLPDLRHGLQASLLGQLAIVASSISYAGATVFARNRLRGQPPLTSTMGQLTTGALFTMPLSLLIDRPFSLSPSPAAIASWLALTILGTVVAYVIYYALIERTSATFVSTVTYVIPIVGLILGALVLHEPVTINLLISTALIIAGVLLVRT
ncbi:MAG: EamA family transporter [Anaerolineae bacterium]|nr:EamA family transporter [Anaerolineae bacterium]